jgi:uncharacterized protein YidB (DUF937 family)
MGLLDTILSGMAGQSAGRSAGQSAGGGLAANPLLQVALQMLAASGQSGGQGGGLSALIEQFQRAGMGQQMNSWISTGQNLPISPDQLMQVFGQDQLQQVAANNGLDSSQLSGGLADLLPQLIDQLTPGGKVPATGIDGALAELSKMMPRG